MAANSSPGSTILLPTGTYTLTIPGTDGTITNAAIGDLDILAATTIIGAGVGITIVQAGATPFAGIHRVFDNHSAGSVYISNMTIRHGLDVEASSGGCIRNSGILTLELVTVNGCASPVAGGGIASYHTLTVFRATITGNRVTSSTGTVVNGGGIGGGPGPVLGASSTVTIRYTVLSNNEVSSAGDINDTANGGGFANTAIMHISDSVITGNAALSVGGGINTATMTITNSIISENRARYSAGGVDNDGVMTVSHSTFVGNVAGFGCVGSQCDDAYAGGALNTSGGTLDVDSSTFSGNSCVRSGGGILNAGGTLTISSSTFAGNTCQFAAGVGAGDTTIMKNTIVANNTATDASGGDTGGLITSLGYNLIQRTTGSIIGGDQTGNIIGQDPRLGALQDNGGPTLTRGLNVGSPALNTGNPGGCLDHAGAPLLRDQRGYPRLQQGRCDIGAFEAGLGPARAIGDYDANGKADILFQHTSGTLYTWFMDGLSVSSHGPVGTVGGGWAVQGAGDFNGDSKADILWRHTSGTTYVWLMNGTTVSGSGSPGSVDGSWATQGIGDFNGDGRADILWRHASGLLHLWFMNGTSIGGAAPAGSASTEWTIQDVGDYDGDGRTDILWRHPSGVVYVWLMNGTSISSHGSPGTVAPDWAIETVGDFNADGRADILWRHPSGVVYVWLMNGTSRGGTGSPGSTTSAWMIE